jgi:predicted SAM-dependent methyltransferase
VVNITKGLRSSVQSAINELNIFLLHNKGLHRTKHFRNNQNLKLHLGCGDNVKEGFINIDLTKKADLQLDLRENLPFSDNSCLLIYSEHFLEHLVYPDEVTLFLNECHRILKPGGMFSVGVPDTEWIMLAYAEQIFPHCFPYPIQNKFHAEWGNRYSAWLEWCDKNKWHAPWCKTKMEHINYHFRNGVEHHFAYDFETLKHILHLVGFREIKQRDYNAELDSISRKIGTLYVDAMKV